MSDKDPAAEMIRGTSDKFTTHRSLSISLSLTLSVILRTGRCILSTEAADNCGFITLRHNNDCHSSAAAARRSYKTTASYQQPHHCQVPAIDKTLGHPAGRLSVCRRFNATFEVRITWSITREMLLLLLLLCTRISLEPRLKSVSNVF